MDEHLIQKIKRIYQINGLVNIHWLCEHYPELLEQIQKKYGSLKNAVTSTNIEKKEYRSGYYP